MPAERRRSEGRKTRGIVSRYFVMRLPVAKLTTYIEHGESRIRVQLENKSRQKRSAAGGGGGARDGRATRERTGAKGRAAWIEFIART